MHECTGFVERPILAQASGDRCSPEPVEVVSVV
jgi:hypothetical protein